MNLKALASLVVVLLFNTALHAAAVSAKIKNPAKIKTLENTLESCDGGIEDSPDFAAHHARKAHALVELADLKHEPNLLKDALACFAVAIKLEPFNPIYLVNRANLHILLNDKKSAQDDVESVKKIELGAGFEKLYVESKLEEIKKKL